MSALQRVGIQQMLIRRNVAVFVMCVLCMNGNIIARNLSTVSGSKTVNRLFLKLVGFSYSIAGIKCIYWEFFIKTRID